MSSTCRRSKHLAIMNATEWIILLLYPNQPRYIVSPYLVARGVRRDIIGIIGNEAAHGGLMLVCDLVKNSGVLQSQVVGASFGVARREKSLVTRLCMRPTGCIIRLGKVAVKAWEHVLQHEYG